MKSDAAICLAWWGPGSAAKVAWAHNTTSRHVRHVWEHGKAVGDLPRIERPKGGFNPAIIFQGPFGSSFANEFPKAKAGEARAASRLDPPTEHPVF